MLAKSPQRGVILSQFLTLDHARAVDEVDCLLLQFTLLNPPRGTGARHMAERIQSVHKNAEVVPYAWQLITHRHDDGLRDMGTRGLQGDESKFGGLQQTPEVDQAFAAMVQTLQGFSATRMALRTPPSLTPGPVGRARLTAFAARCKQLGISLVWEPEGLWEFTDARAFAESLDVALLWPVWPLLKEGLTSLDHVWLRVDGQGGKQALSPGHLDELSILAEDAHAPLMFTGPRAYQNLASFVAFSS